MKAASLRAGITTETRGRCGCGSIMDTAIVIEALPADLPGRARHVPGIGEPAHPEGNFRDKAWPSQGEGGGRAARRRPVLCCGHAESTRGPHVRVPHFA